MVMYNQLWRTKTFSNFSQAKNWDMVIKDTGMRSYAEASTIIQCYRLPMLQVDQGHDSINLPRRIGNLSIKVCNYYKFGFKISDLDFDNLKLNH